MGPFAHLELQLVEARRLIPSVSGVLEQLGERAPCGAFAAPRFHGGWGERTAPGVLENDWTEGTRWMNVHLPPKKSWIDAYP